MTKLLKLYRISDASASSIKKEKLSFATKKYCLDNFLKIFGRENTHIIADNVNEETYLWLQSYKLPLIRSHKESESQVFRNLIFRALMLDPENYIYFAEDDYLHRKGSEKILLEGLQEAHYVSLYDHPDKYISFDRGGNIEVIGNGEDTKVFLTESTHWKLTNSTTCCFATRIETLFEDQEVFWRATEGSITRDYWMFKTLRDRGRTIATPIPAMATHCEIKYLSPLVDWTRI